MDPDTPTQDEQPTTCLRRCALCKTLRDMRQDIPTLYCDRCSMLVSLRDTVWNSGLSDWDDRNHIEMMFDGGTSGFTPKYA